MKTILYLARHGETQWNKIQRFQGQLDSELTVLGKQQSVFIANNLQDKQVSGIFCSPLGRALNTAKLCQKSLNIGVVTDIRLTERNLGPWQGQLLEKISLEPYFDEILHHYTDRSPPNGESAISCGERVYHGVKNIAIKFPDKSLLIIAHGEALRCFLSKLGQQLKGNAYQLFNNASIITLVYCHNSETFEIA
jgi:broad specificity phosphatase PhoE